MGGKHLGASRVPRTTSEVMLLLLGDAQGTGVGDEGEAEVNRAVMTVVLRPCLPPGPDLHNVLQRESFPAERKSSQEMEQHGASLPCVKLAQTEEQLPCWDGTFIPQSITVSPSPRCLPSSPLSSLGRLPGRARLRSWHLTSNGPNSFFLEGASTQD